MAKFISKGEVRVLGIDLSKHNFQLHGVDEAGRVVLRKRLSRVKLREFLSNLPICLVGMEACGGAHYWARALRGMGHTVRLMAPQFVKPYVKSNKNDANDAQAICEAVQRPGMRFVAVKTVAQQDLQSLHRMRSLAIGQRTAQSQQIRGLLLEYGIVISGGIAAVRKAIPALLEEADKGLTPTFCALLGELYEALLYLDARVAGFDKRIRQLSEANAACRRLMSVPGIGPMSASALVAAVGDAGVFKNGRAMAAWLGLVPRQRSTGGKPTLLGISKRGDSYLRMLLIHGGRSVVRFAPRHTDRRSRWVTELESRRGKNIAAVAVANKNVRTAWALLRNQSNYRVEGATLN